MIDKQQYIAMLDAARKGDVVPIQQLADVMAEAGDAKANLDILRVALYLDNEEAGVTIDAAHAEGLWSYEMNKAMRWLEGLLKTAGFKNPKIKDLSWFRESYIKRNNGYVSAASLKKIKSMMKRFGIEFSPEPSWRELLTDRRGKGKNINE